MKAQNTDLLRGFKTFLIAPDLTLVSPDLTEEAFLAGFELYLLHDTALDLLELKLSLLIKEFTCSLFCFFIDRLLPLELWVDFIESLQARLGERQKICVFYRTQSQEEYGRTINRLFLMELGIQGGCVALSSSLKKNKLTLLEVLAANEAEGQRKCIRMTCPGRFSLNFRYGGRLYAAKMLDMSTSHISFRFSGSQGVELIEPGQHLRDVQLLMRGVLCMVELKIVLKRNTDAGVLYVAMLVYDPRISLAHSRLRDKINNLIMSHYQFSMSLLIGTTNETDTKQAFAGLGNLARDLGRWELAE